MLKIELNLQNETQLRLIDKVLTEAVNDLYEQGWWTEIQRFDGHKYKPVEVLRVLHGKLVGQTWADDK